MTENAATTYAHCDWPALVAKLGGSGRGVRCHGALGRKVKGTAGDICATEPREIASVAEETARHS